MIHSDNSIYIILVTILIIILSLTVFYLFYLLSNEKIEYYNRFAQSNSYNMPYYPWGMSTRSTRGMSYDLRGDPFIPRQYVGPWLNSSLTPIRNKPLWMVS